MESSKNKIVEELRKLIDAVRSLDKKVVTVFISIAILETISWYYTSRTAYQQYFYDSFGANSNTQFYEFIYWYAGDFIVLFVIPALIVKFYFKEKLKSFGITIGDYITGIKLSIIFLIIMIPLIWLVSAEPAFGATYPLLDSARSSWKIFIIYEAGLLIYLFAWEFIWRGFMLFGLKDKFGYYAIFIQMIPFLLLHYGKPPLEAFGVILGGLALGALAYRTKSIYYCIITHAGIMFSIDFICTLRFRTGEFGIGFTSLFHILKDIL